MHFAFHSVQHLCGVEVQIPMGNNLSSSRTRIRRAGKIINTQYNLSTQFLQYFYRQNSHCKFPTEYIGGFPTRGMQDSALYIKSNTNGDKDLLYLHMYR